VSAQASAETPPTSPSARVRPAVVRGLAAQRLRVVDVAIFYGERSGGIRTYLEAKARFAQETNRFEHHLVIPGAVRAGDGRGRHEQRSVGLASSNGYRLPIGGSGPQATLAALDPDVVLLHDPYWTPRSVTRTAHALGAVVVAVHHASVSLQATGLPGPHGVYATALRRWYRHAYAGVDAVMSVVDPEPDTGRPATFPLRLGLEPAFRPRPEVVRGDHVLYVGRLSREKGVRELMEATAAAAEPWPLVLLGSGPLDGALRERARRLGIAHRVTFTPFRSDRDELARRFAGARCAVLPGAHETFGLAALEAAACATPVVIADTAPCGRLLGDLAERFRAGDSEDLRRAIERGRRHTPDHMRAQQLADEYAWDRTLADELADIERLVTRR